MNQLGRNTIQNSLETLINCVMIKRVIKDRTFYPDIKRKSAELIQNET